MEGMEGKQLPKCANSLIKSYYTTVFLSMRVYILKINA